MPDALEITLPDGAELTVELADLALPCVIGRDSASAQIVVADGQASRSHCTLAQRPDGSYQIEDLGSMNGTWINDQRVTRAVLAPGDELRIGTTRIRLRPPPAPADPLVGTRIGGYQIEEVLGNGRFGTVYRAVQVNLQRPVALKVLSAEFRSDPVRVQAFLDEARRAGRLNHPNLVQVHDIQSVDTHTVLVMELMSHSLAGQLKEEGPLPEDEVWDVLLDIAKALAYAESQRIVHRDVKPDNILVSAEGVAKLADLGIAMQLGEDGTATQDEVFGSPHYVAPEQAKGIAIDGRADLYALGATAWHLLVGKPVFQGNAKQLVAAHCATPVPDLRKVRPGTAPGLVELLHRLLEKDPARRPAKAQDLIELIGTQRKRTATVVPRSTRKRPIRRLRRRR